MAIGALRTGVILICTGLLLACAPARQVAGPPAEPITVTALLDPSRFGPRPQLPSVESVFSLTAEQEQAFLAHFNDPERATLAAHERVYAYIEQRLQDFHYFGKTYPASHSLRTKGGNCLGLAVMTAALARVAGVDIGYQRVSSVPVFLANRDLVLSSGHVRAVLYDPAFDPEHWLRRPGIAVDYFPEAGDRAGAIISEAQVIAMYYRNLAAERLAEGDYGNAFWLVRESLAHAPDHSEAINMLAVLHRRVGDEATAERLYVYGLERARNKLSLLDNYRRLLAAQQRHAEAEAISQQLVELNDPSPFRWLELAHHAHQRGEPREALQFYRKALAAAPYLHQAHVGMAGALYQLGQPLAAEAALRQALLHSHDDTTQALYQAKLERLSSR